MNNHAQHDIMRWQAAEEGQFFERKSAVNRSGPRLMLHAKTDKNGAEAATMRAEAATFNADGPL